MIQLEKEGNVANITLNRPPANSYEINFLKLFADTVDKVSKDSEIKVVVIKSASEKFFIAGADIKVFQENDTAANKEMVVVARSVCEKIESSDKIFIAAVAGHALGGGLELIMACDFRLAAEGEYLLGLPEVKLGLMPGNGGTVRLVQLIGAAKAFEIMVLGDPFKPAQALELGLLNKLIPKDKFEGEVQQFAKKIAMGPAKAMTNMKKFVKQSFGLSTAEGLALEEKLVDELYDSEDAKEGLLAFKEKREAKFK